MKPNTSLYQALQFALVSALGMVVAEGRLVQKGSIINPGWLIVPYLPVVSMKTPPVIAGWTNCAVIMVVPLLLSVVEWVG